ncbi:PAS domain S-box protein [Cereibacter changlensis]|uniref:PAS domain S-box protein n=1 Tax=Cereibacter changlensis TaxID=402884 RepID=UPI0040336A2C
MTGRASDGAETAALQGLASALLRAAVSDLPVLLAAALARLGEGCGARRVLLCEVAEDGGLPPVAGWPDAAAPEPLPSAQRALLQAGQGVSVDDILLVPLIAGGGLAGLLRLEGGAGGEAAVVGPLADALANALLRLAEEAERQALRDRLARTAGERDQAAQRLESFAAIGDQWFWEIDADLRHVFSAESQVARAIFDGMDLAGKTIEELALAFGCDPFDRQWRAIRRTLAMQEPFDGFTFVLRDRRGGEHHLSVSGRPVFDAEGLFAGYRGVGASITDRMHREGAARATANRFEATLNALPDLLIEADHMGRYTRIYSDAGSAARLHDSDCLGRSFDEALPPEIAATFTEAMRIIERTGRAESLRYRSGDAWHELSGARRVPEAAEDAPGFVFLVRDVTADERQKERLRLLGKIVELMTNLATVVDAEQRVVWVNPAFEAHTGYRLDEIRGLPIAELTQGKDADPAALARMVEAVDRGEDCRVELLNRDKAGRPYWVDLNIHPLRGAAGEMLGYVSVATVITEQKQALADLEAAQQRMARIVEGAEVGTWEWMAGDDRLTVDSRWCEMLGYALVELAAPTLDWILTRIHPDDLPAVLDTRETARGNDGLALAEFRMRHREGHWIWILSRGRITRWGPDGRAESVAGVNIDISERKALEQRVVAARNFFFNAMENSIAAITVLNAKGQMVFANSEAERILGLPRSELLGRDHASPKWQLTTFEGFPVEDAASPLHIAVTTGEPVRAIRHGIVLPDGSRRILSVNAVPMQEEGELQVLCSFTDITDQLETLGQIRAALSHAEEASRSKSLFLANMSHEIRTPLNGVLGMAELLDNSLSEPRQKLMIRTIRNSGETLLSILNNILDMSKIEAGKFGLENVPFNPADLARQVEAVYAMNAEEKGLQFEVLVGLGGDAARMGDPHRILQILHNLLSNAVKFTDKGQVTMRLTCRPGKPLAVEVVDTGIGMTEEQAARVFDSFDQADGSVTRRFGGTGLGMSIVRQLVLLMGGEIAVSSRLGEGTKVQVSLPLPAAEQEVAPSVAPPAGAEPGFAGRRLLIADDSATNRLVLKEMLADTGAEVTLVEDGRQALAAWTGAAFDLLLLDISMPVMDGLTALKQIREQEALRGSAPVPAVAVTANAMAHQVADYIIGGFDTHLAKPFRRNELLHAISTLLRRP